MKKSCLIFSLVLLNLVSLNLLVTVAAENETDNDAGKITGKVIFSGEAKAPKQVDITKDAKVCGKVPHFDEQLIVSKDKGLANVIVSLKNVKNGKSLDSMGAEFALDQNGCQFVPHIVIVPTGASLKIKNSDGILHNLHTFGEANQPVNKAQPRFLKVIKLSFDKPEIIRIVCDVHGWMTGYIAVVDNPYCAKTDTDGNFELTGVPDGTYAIEYWHETLGKKGGEVTVSEGTAAITMAY